jgi:uncharacterized protein
VTTLVIIAKEPIAGRVKTRLRRQAIAADAAAVAAACIDDTIAGLAGVSATRRILFYAGDNVPISARGYDVIAQPSGGLDERLAAIFDECSGPTLLVGMDTPQLTVGMLNRPFGSWPADVDAWIGPATDGGFWALGMRDPRGDLIRGVPMSRADTGAIQRARLEEAGLRVGTLQSLTDVDTIDSAWCVAESAPLTSFAALLSGLAAPVARAS